MLCVTRLCLERGTAKTASAPNVAAPLSSHGNSRSPVALCSEVFQFKCVHLAWVPGDAESPGSGSQQCSPSAFVARHPVRKSQQRDKQSVCCFLSHHAGEMHCSVEGKHISQRGSGQQLPGTPFLLPQRPPECQCRGSGSLAP